MFTGEQIILFVAAILMRQNHNETFDFIWLFGKQTVSLGL